MQRRSRSDAVLLLAIFAGVLIAATVLSGARIYVRSLERVGVTRATADLVPGNESLTVTNTRMPFTRTVFEEGGAFVRESAEPLEGLIKGDGDFVKTPRVLWGPIEEGVRFLPDENGNPFPLGIIQRLSHLTSHVRFIEGGPASEVVNFEGDIPVVEIMVPRGRAADLGLSVGDVLEVGPTPNEFGRFIAVIAGIFEPIDLEDPFWGGVGLAFIAPSGSNPLLPPPLAMFLRGDAIWQITSNSPIAVGQGLWFLFLDTEALKGELRGDLISRIHDFEDIVEKRIPRARVGTGPLATYEGLDRRAIFSQTPTYLMGALLISVAAYYLYLVSGLLVQKRREDISMLRSRGISTAQVGRMYALELLPIVAMPVIAAPFIALLIVSQLGRIGAYEVITRGDALPIELSWIPFAAAIGAGIATSLVLVAPAVIQARNSIVAEKKLAARPTQRPLFQRFFLDFVVLILGGLVIWELRTQQSIVVTDSSGEQSIDIAAMFGPVLILVAAGLIFLRVFPFLLRIISLIAGRRAPVWVAMALWKLARSPYQYAWPILLLVLASGLGVLAGTLSGTLELSADQRIQYETASDFHIENLTAEGGIGGSTIQDLASIPGIDATALGLKGNAKFGTTGSGYEFELFALEPSAFADISWFREDFSDGPLSPLLQTITITESAPDVLLPEGAIELGMWARIDPPGDNLFLWVTLKDATGRSFTVTLGPLQGPDWHYQSSEVPDRVVHPATIASVRVFEPTTGDSGTPTTFWFDDMDALVQMPDGSVERHLIVPFENRDDWGTLATSEGLDTEFTLVAEPTELGMHSGEQIGQMVLGRGTTAGVRGIYRSVFGDALPVLASETLLTQLPVVVGVPFVAQVFGIFTPIVIVDTVKYFPTLDPDLSGFVITDYDAISDFLESLGQALPNSRDEIYFSTEEEDLTELVSEVRRRTSGVVHIVDSRSLKRQLLVDPLAIAGWEGMALVALVGTLLIISLGYITYIGSYINGSAKESAQLSVLGITRGTYLLMISTEHLIVGLVGLVLGTFTGLLMTNVAVSSIAHTESGGKLIPPFVLTTEWFGIGFVYIAIGIIAVFAAVRLFAGYRRLALTEILRLEE
jgi:hypothetical protein